MKVHRRGASSPSLLLEASEPPTSVNVNGNYYQFELEPHHVERGKRGQKVFVCDLCPPPNGIFKRSFSLKRHYLRFHINFAFLSPRDLNNCAIAVAGQHQRSGFPNSGVNGRMINRHSSPSPLLYRCHQCGCLLRTKNDLLKHLETHPGPPETGANELINGDHRATNRCPRCSTAFSLRKTLMRHIKKNRCRGGNPPTAPSPPIKVESEIGARSGETSDPGDDSLASREEESEEMDMEASLRLGCPSSLFRFACTLCAKMFNSYVNMCRHRRLAHGRYGICSPHWLLSRKLSGKPALHHAVPSSVTSPRNPQDLSHFVHNANDNLNKFIDGKKNNIRSVAPIDETFDVPDEGNPPPDRWSWGKSSYNVQELLKLDVPLQLAYYRGLELWKLQETAKTEESSSQAGPEEMDITSALDLHPIETSESVARKETDSQRPELSGEWIRSKNYICSPCGQIFQDFLALLDHQQTDHGSVWCTHIQLNQSAEAGLVTELTRQIIRSGNGEPAHSVDAFKCTKCHFAVQSIPELHSHILLCSNHVSASPSRKRRIKVNPSSRRSHWRQNEAVSGGNKGLQRSISSQTKNSSTSRSLRSRSPKEDFGEDNAPGTLRRSTRRVLSFNESTPTKKKKSTVVTKRVLRQRVDMPQMNGTASSQVTKKSEAVKKKKNPSPNSKSLVKVDVDLHECDGCQKKFQSRTSVLKHKYYCPNKESESSIDGPSRTPTPPPPVKPYNIGKATTKRKSEVSDLKTIQDKHGRSIKTQQQSLTVSSSPKTKSQIARSNGIHPTNSDAQTKKSKKATASTNPVLHFTTPTKSKLPSKKVVGPTKSVRGSTKIVRKKDTEPEETEPEEIAASGRPVRSSRKASITLVMEDQVEASFLEALSPEQRVRVSEQKCPFCSKHYVYRSNFKKHLLEGCDTADADERSVSTTLTVKKSTLQEKCTDLQKSPVQSNADSKMEMKGKREKSETLKKVEKKIKPTEKEKTSKKEKIPVKPYRNISRNLSPSKEEPEKFTKTSRKPIKVTEVPQKFTQKTKKVPDKKIEDLMEIQQKNGRMCRTPAACVENGKILNDIREKETIEVETTSCVFDREKKNEENENSKKQTCLPESENPTNGTRSTNDTTEDTATLIVSDTIEEDGLVRSSLEENWSKRTPKNDETTCCHSNESSFYKDRELGWNLSQVNDLHNTRTSNGYSPQDESSPSSENESNCNRSHALNRLELGQALDDAIRTGIFKPYSNLTMYPMRMRQLKEMAQAYCLSNASEATRNYLSCIPLSKLSKRNTFSSQP